MTHRDPTIPPSLKDKLDDDKETAVFRKFQESSMMKHVLPRCDVPTEYDKKKSQWEIPSARYLEEVLGVGKTYPVRAPWDDLLKLIDNAKAQYKDKGDNSGFRRVLRQGKGVADVLTGLVELIPDENGLGVLRVGLSMLFTAWSDNIKNSEKVLQSLSDIPVILSVALEQWQFFKTDERLQRAIRELYSDLMDAIRALIDILLHKSPSDTSLPRRIFSRAKEFIPNHVAESIDQILATVNIAKTKVDNNVARLDREMAASTHINTEFTAAEAIATHETMKDAKHLVAGVATGVSVVSETVRAQHQEDTMNFGKTQEMIKGVESKFSSVQQTMETFGTQLNGGYYLIPKPMLEWVVLAHNSFYHFNTEQTYRESLSPSLHGPNPVPRYIPTTLPKEELMNIICVNPSLPIEDRDTVLRKGQVMSPDQLGRGRFLLVAPQFQHLLSSPTSTMLLVDGHCKESCDGKVSPVSVFCASLAAMMAHDRAYMVLTFFAGQHCRYDDANDPARGPRGLVRSLIDQVLLYPHQPEPYLDWLNDTLVDDVARGQLEALCYLFVELVKRVVGVSTIFCIVDNISEFETKLGGWNNDLKIVFDHLVSLCNAGSGLSSGASFKLLMTSAEKSTQVVQSTNPSERLSLRAGNVLSPEKAGWAVEREIQRSVSPRAPYERRISD